MFVFVRRRIRAHYTQGLEIKKNKNLVGCLFLFVSQLQVYDCCLIWCLKVTQQSRDLSSHYLCCTPLLSDLCERTLTGSLFDLVISCLCLGMKTRVAACSGFACKVNYSQSCISRELIRFQIPHRLIVCLFGELAAH